MRILVTCLVLASGLLLAGCDACGRFPWEPKGETPSACRTGPPAR